jgi:hypothetical protein
VRLDINGPSTAGFVFGFLIAGSRHTEGSDQAERRARPPARWEPGVRGSAPFCVSEATSTLALSIWYMALKREHPGPMTWG